LKKDSTISYGYRAPLEGEVFQNPTLAETFKLLAAKKKDGFYDGSVGRAILSAVQRENGYHTLEDLKDQAKDSPEVIQPVRIRLIDDRKSPSVKVDLWEHPPNGQGIVALMALGILQELEQAGHLPEFSDQTHNSARYVQCCFIELH